MLLGRHGAVDPRGVHIQNANVVGTLDLRYVHTSVSLSMLDCEFDEPVILFGAHLPRLHLDHSKIPYLHADGVNIDAKFGLTNTHIGFRTAEKGAIRLAGAYIRGCLDMSDAVVSNDTGPLLVADGIHVDGGMFLDRLSASCNTNSGAVQIRRGHVSGQLNARGAVLVNDSGTALCADGITIDGDVFLDSGFTARSTGELGTIRLLSAYISGQLTMNGAKIANNMGPAIEADRVRVDGDVKLDDGFTGLGQGQHGTVRLPGARIGGQLTAKGATLTNDSGPALCADQIEVRGLSYLDDLVASGSGEIGAIRFLGGRLGDNISFSGARIVNNSSGPAFGADRLIVDGGVSFSGTFAATSDCSLGTIRFPSARINGRLDVGNAVITNTTGPALHCDGVEISDGAFFEDGFSASGVGKQGTIRLPGARIRGQLSFSGATLTNSSGPALCADRLQVENGAFLDEGFNAIGEGEDGVIAIPDAHVRGQLIFSNAVLTNRSGPALCANDVHVEDSLQFDDLSATGATDEGVIQMMGAHIGSQLSLSGAILTNDSGPALLADQIQVDDSIFMDCSFTATGHTSGSTVEITGASIAGHLVLSQASLHNDHGDLLNLENTTVGAIHMEPEVICAGNDHRPHNYEVPLSTVSTDGLVYTHSSGISEDFWLHVIRHHTSSYAPQPYQHLASRLKANGHDRSARRVLIAQQQDLRRRGEIGGWFTTSVHWLWGSLAGYGYRAGRIALALIAVLALSGLAGWWAGHTVTGPGQHAAQHTNTTSRAGTPCSTIEQIGLGIDRGLPLATTGIRSSCDLDTETKTGQYFTLGIWLLQAIIWSFATLAVAGYTGLIRKVS